MPAITSKHSVPGCKGQVVLYGSGTSSGKYFYREWLSDEKRYRTHLLSDARDATEAIELAVSVAFSWREMDGDDQRSSISLPSNRTTHTAKKRHPTATYAAHLWVSKAEKDYNSGLIAKNTYYHKEKVFRLYLLPYLTSQGYTTTGSFNHNTFQEYLSYRSQTTALVRARELSIIKDWVFNFLMPNDMLSSTPSKAWFPDQKIRQTDRMSNPAINPEDWQTIITYVRNTWRSHLANTGHQNHRAYFWRDLFWHYLLVAKNTGMSPEEILKLKWKNVEIRDVGRINSKGERVEWLVAYIRTIRSKTQQAREIPTNLGRELKRWMSIVKAYCDEHDLAHPTNDSYIFGNPYYDFKPYTYGNYKQAWVAIRRDVQHKLKGHRFSNHPYTLYSLRATFIETHLLKGTDLFLLARMAGHDVKELMQSYERLDIRQRAKEITAIQFGKKKEEEYLIDLLSDDTNDNH